MAFSSQGDRIALTQIEQMIDGKYVILGHYDTQADNLTWTGLEKWRDNKVSFIYFEMIHPFVAIRCAFQCLCELSRSNLFISDGK